MLVMGSVQQLELGLVLVLEMGSVQQLELGLA